MSNQPACREERRRLGLSYPKSGCYECGTLLRKNWRCPKELDDTYEGETMPENARIEDGYLLIPALPEKPEPKYRGVQCGQCRVRFENVNAPGCFHARCPLRHRQRT